jgi:hypothetical protein
VETVKFKVSSADDKINFAVSFDFNHEKTKIILNGFNRFERNENNIRVASGTREEETREIYVLGEDISFDIKGYTSGNLEEETDKFEYEIKSIKNQDFSDVINLLISGTGILFAVFFIFNSKAALQTIIIIIGILFTILGCITLYKALIERKDNMYNEDTEGELFKFEDNSSS